jgi:hypothetical protein
LTAASIRRAVLLLADAPARLAVAGADGRGVASHQM